MQNKSSRTSGLFHPRILLALTLCSASLLPASSVFAAAETGGTLAPTAVVSQKTHGSLTPGIALSLSGPVGIECRKGQGATSDQHQVIVTFPTAVTVGGASATPDPKKPGATASVANFSVKGAQVTVNLSGVSNAQTLTIHLTGVSNGTKTVGVDIPMAVLLGDTNGDGVVNSADISQTKSRSGQAVDGTNFRSDVTADDALNSGDIALVKSKSGTALPP